MATFAGKTYTNGNVPNSLLAPLDGENYGEAELRRDAAAAWNRARAEVKAKTGIVLTVRGWNRSIAEQERFFFERYKPGVYSPFGDYRTYKGVTYGRVSGAPAAIPGTSNHGWGLAVDIDDFGAYGTSGNARSRLATPILEKHGWTDDEGSSIGEPWHRVYKPERDQRRTTPTTIPEDDMPSAEEIAKAVWDHKLPVPAELRKELGDKPRPARQLFASMLVRADRAEDLSRGGLTVDRQNRTKLVRVEDAVEDLSKEN